MCFLFHWTHLPVFLRFIIVFPFCFRKFFLIFGFAATVFGVDFNREVRPILSEHCFQCHGLDQQKSKLRLDFEEFAHKGGKSGLMAVASGKPDKSEMIRRVTDRGEDRMPPKGKGLSKTQVDTLRRWIGEGGKYDKHWAYVVPKRPDLPAVKATKQIANPIDRFTLSRLEELGLTFSEPADKARWLRRVSLDLLGLPPRVVQLDAFLTDNSENAREKVVDALQRSPRYGEHWARQWLDLARYADSNGFQADQLRDSWAYRDWVIEAMNADMPFDQFTIEQIAGDILPEATFSQKVATGFHRTPTCNVEAGVHPEENRVNQVVDRVNATGTTWLGTTMECAQCHSHKYDPVSQEEYYQLFAFFNNTPLEVKGGGGVTFNFWGPTMDLPPDKGQNPPKLSAEAALKAKEKELEVTKKSAEAKFENWLAAERKKLGKEDPAPLWTVLQPTQWKSSGKEPFTLLDDGSLLVGGKSGAKSIYEIETEAPKDKLASVRLETLLHDSLPSKGPGRNRTNANPNFVLNEVTVFLLEPGKEPVPLKLTLAKVDYTQPSFSAKGLIDGKRDLLSAWAIAAEFGKPHWATMDLAKPVEPAPGSKLLFKLEHLYGGGRNVGRPRFSASPEPARQHALPKEIGDLLRKPKPTARETKKLLAHYLKSDDELAKLEKAVAAAKKKVYAIKPVTTLVMVEMNKPRETRVMSRGNYLDPKQKVAPGTPAALHPWKKEWPANRLGFAQWLVDPANPLVARVAVNRWWGQFFGSGIVSTEEDFGSQCEPPTHPELLDWLAVEFMEKGWSMKKLHKTIVLSATYGQSSRVTPELLEKDPNNLWFARGPRFRLTAEMIRDNALRISGLLSEKMGGSPIYPPQPAGLWRQTGRNEPKYVAATNQDRFRRGIYVIWRRAAPYPSFVNFDGPDRSACHPKRSRTNTPLQALTLLNDEAYVEMALGFAIRVLEDKPKADLDERLRYAFRRTLAREPDARELNILRELHAGELARLIKDKGSAKNLLDGIKAVKFSAKLDPNQLAAWFFVANALLNLDETVTKG